jgi:hypothetical protein
MRDLPQVLKQGEHPVQQYEVRLTEFARTGWIKESPLIRVFVTNHNLILLPESSETDHQSVIIPLEQIYKLWHVGLGRRDGLLLYLTSGERLHMLVNWNQGRLLVRDIRNVLNRMRNQGTIPTA